MQQQKNYRTLYLKICRLFILFFIISNQSFSQIGFSTPSFSGKDARAFKLKWLAELRAGLPLGFPLKINKFKQKPILVFEPSVKWAWYNFKNNYVVSSENSVTLFTPDTIPTHIYNNKLFKTTSMMQQTSFYLPINIVLKPKNMKGFSFAPGFYVEYLLAGKFKRKYNDGSAQSLSNKFSGDKDFYSFQRFQYGPCGHASYKFVTIYGVYSLTPVFIKNRGPELKKYSVGIWFNFFWKKHSLKPY